VYLTYIRTHADRHKPIANHEKRVCCSSSFSVSNICYCSFLKIFRDLVPLPRRQASAKLNIKFEQANFSVINIFLLVNLEFFFLLLQLQFYLRFQLVLQLQLTDRYFSVILPYQLQLKLTK